jgi:bifunctional non-homologous end joining protein LigD
VLVKRHPDMFTQEFIKADRQGRILIDTGRNRYSATFAAVYGVRARPGAPVSAPCTWKEVEHGGVGPRSFTLRTMSDRVADVGDLWADMYQHRQSLRRPFERLRALLTAEDWEEATHAATRRPAPRKRRGTAER